MAETRTERHERNDLNDLEVARTLGTLTATLASVSERLDKMDKKLDGVVAMTNRWKGATAILIIFGGIVGWASTLFLKMLGKA